MSSSVIEIREARARSARVDEDLAVADLVAGRRSREKAQSLKRWLARRERRRRPR
jgi:hypothetical protein